MKYLTFDNLEHHAKTIKRNYWRVKAEGVPSYRWRWGYMKIVIDWLRQLQPSTVLEAGTAGIPLCDESVSVGLSAAGSPAPKVIYDLRKTPWPFTDKEFDAFVALQVFEHLGPCEKEAFAESQRVSKNVFLSVPFKWECSKRHSRSHLFIDDDTVLGWATNAELVKSKTVTPFGSTDPELCRKIYHFAS